MYNFHLLAAVSIVVAFTIWFMLETRRTKKWMNDVVDTVIEELEVTKAKYSYYARNETDPELLDTWNKAIASLDDKIEKLKTRAKDA